MIDVLAPCLRVAGAGLLALAILNIPLARKLRWREESARMSPFTASVFLVHAFFIGLVLVAMGLPCLLDPHALLDGSRAAGWGCWSMAAFWTARLWCQWFVYRPAWWRGKRLETFLHWWSTAAWLYLAALFTVCGSRHAGWLA